MFEENLNKCYDNNNEVRGVLENCKENMEKCLVYFWNIRFLRKFWGSFTQILGVRIF